MRTAWLILAFALISTSVLAFRMERPITLTYPLDTRQVRKLNDTLQLMWDIQNGRQNFDVVTTSKTAADNGDLWIIQTANIAYIQIKSNDHVYTFTPDGY